MWCGEIVVSLQFKCELTMKKDVLRAEDIRWRFWAEGSWRCLRAESLRWCIRLLCVGMCWLVPMMGGDWGAEAQTFSFTAPSGHVLRATIVDGVAEVSKQTAMTVSGRLVIPDTVRNGSMAYSVERIGSFSSTTVDTVVLPNTTRVITNRAFSNCALLMQVVMGDSVQSIGQYAFYRCGALQGVALPTTVETIGQYAFAECGGLADTLTIPDATLTLGRDAFSQCRHLRAVHIGGGLRVVPDECFAYCDSLRWVEVGPAVDTLSRGAFFDCLSLTEIVLPAGLAAVGIGTFEGCAALQRVALPDSVREIGAYAFSQCSSLERVTMGLGLGLIGRYAFNRCLNLDSVCFLSAVPPALEVDAFGNMSEGTVFYVPCGSARGYANAWGLDVHLGEPEAGVTLQVEVDDPAHGSAEAPEGVRCDSTAVVVATAGRGYRFEAWSNGRTANPDTLRLTGDSTVVAHFAAEEYRLRVEVNHGEWGTATGGGVYEYGTEAELSATAFAGFQFLQWDDGVAENPRRVRVESDTLFTALFGREGSAEGTSAETGARVLAAWNGNGVTLTVENAEGQQVTVVDRLGRQVATVAHATDGQQIVVPMGEVYIVRVGAGKAVVINLPAIGR